MHDYDTDQWLIFNYINGAGGKFLTNCFFQFDKVANWYGLGLSKQQRADRYLESLTSNNNVWLSTEPDQPWGLNFFSRTYPRGQTCEHAIWNQQVERQSSDYFKKCWSQKKIIADFWHKGTRPTFWSDATWITIRVDDWELYKSLLFTKVYDYNKHEKTVINQMENPMLGSDSNKKYKSQFRNPWHWTNITDIDSFIKDEIFQKPWYQSWQGTVDYDKDNTIDLTHLFDLDKLWSFIVKYEGMFDDSLDFNTIKSLQQAWVQATEVKSKHVF